jgi:hypothetical protein
MVALDIDKHTSLLDLGKMFLFLPTNIRQGKKVLDIDKHTSLLYIGKNFHGLHHNYQIRMKLVDIDKHTSLLSIGKMFTVWSGQGQSTLAHYTLVKKFYVVSPS